MSVGLDLVTVAEVRASATTFGERYLARVYTGAERRQCADDPRRLAECLAVKEATMKALRAPERLPWRSIATERSIGCQQVLKLRGTAAKLARTRGVVGTSFSISSHALHAVAIVLMEMT